MVRLTVRAKPRAKKSRIIKLDGLTAEIALAAPPVDGAANTELITFLADRLALPKRALRLTLGTSSKHKVVEIDLDEATVLERLSQDRPDR